MESLYQKYNCKFKKSTLQNIHIIHARILIYFIFLVLNHFYFFLDILIDKLDTINKFLYHSMSHCYQNQQSDLINKTIKISK